VRTRSLKKRTGILEAAMPVFIARGFQATTMSDVAAAVGGSKQTLYTHFESKEELFLAILERLSADIGHLFRESLAGQGELGLRETLHHLGTHFLSAMNTPEILALRRILIAEGAYSGLGRKIFETGARRGLIQVAEVLETLMDKGLMRRASAWRAACQFAALCECAEMMECLAGARDPLSPEEIRVSVDAAVAVFVSHYAPTNQAGGPITIRRSPSVRRAGPRAIRSAAKPAR